LCSKWQLSSGSADSCSVSDCRWDHDGDPGTREIPLATDQRGYARPSGAGCDIGAVEVAKPGQIVLVLTGALVLLEASKRRA
jgi:hypothetical protein